MADFKPKDRVLAKVEAYVLEGRGDKILLSAESGTHPPMDVRFLARRDDVELVFRFDDPSKDPVGTVRQAPSNTWVVVKSASNAWVPVDANDTKPLLDLDVRGCEVIGAVPGTPAAEAQEPKLRYFAHLGGDATWRWNSETLGVHVNFGDGWEPSAYKTLAELNSAESVKEVPAP